MILLQPSNHTRFGWCPRFSPRQGGHACDALTEGGLLAAVGRYDQDSESDGEVEEPPDMHLLMS